MSAAMVLLRMKSFVSGYQLKRSIHRSPICFQFVKNIYKVIGYNAPFNEDEKMEVLEKINTLPESELSNYTSKKIGRLIQAHRIKNGPFECVEQLLDLPYVERPNAEKICKSLLQDLTLTSLKAKLERNPQNIKKTLFSKGILPKPDVKSYSECVNPTFVGISISLHGLAYSKIDNDRNLLNWSILPGLDNPGSQTAFEHNKLFALTSKLNDLIPDSRYYLLEELLPILPKDPYIKQKINLIKFRTSFMTILKMRRENSIMHTVKPNVLDSIYQLKVGNERTSIQERFDEIVKQRLSEDNPFAVTIPETAWDSYRECNSQGKEYLASSLLKCVAFKHLCSEAQQGFP